jgi:hypothetical protein
MSTTQLPADLSELPLWRLIILLDDIERSQGASCPAAKAVAQVVSDRLGVTSLDFTNAQRLATSTGGR